MNQIHHPMMRNQLLSPEINSMHYNIATEHIIFVDLDGQYIYCQYNTISPSLDCSETSGYDF